MARPDDERKPSQPLLPPEWMPSISRAAIARGAFVLALMGIGGAGGYGIYKHGQDSRAAGFKAGYEVGFERARSVYEPPRKDEGREDWVPGCPPGLWVLPGSASFELNPFDKRKNLYKKEYEVSDIITPAAQQKLTAALRETLAGQSDFFDSKLPSLLASPRNFKPAESGWHNIYEVNVSGRGYENNGHVCAPFGASSAEIKYVEEWGYSSRKLETTDLSFSLSEQGIQLTRVDGNFTTQDLRRLAMTYLRETIPWQDGDPKEKPRLEAVLTDMVDIEGSSAKRVRTYHFNSSGYFQREAEYSYPK